MIVALWGVAAALLGLCFFASNQARSTAADAAHWPRVTGRIVGSDVSVNGNGTYSPQVSYVYEVGGKTYASDRLRPGGTPFFYSAAKAATVAAAYRAGSSAVVHHHPSKPARAALECIAQSNLVLALRIFALAAFFVAAFVTFIP